MKGLETVWRDVVFSVRLLRRAPVLAGVIVLTFALGVAINTAVFSVVNAIVLRPLPVRDGSRIVVIASEDASSRSLHGVSFADLQDYRSAAPPVFEDIAGYSAGFLGLAVEGGRPERVLVTWVTGSYFPLLDVRPALGRLIRANEGGPGRTDPVVVLGYSTWRRRFGADPSVAGTIVRVNGRPCTVVGVAPAGFAGTFAFSESELYLPLNWAGTGDFDNRRARRLHAIARLRPRVAIDTAQAAMDVVSERLSRQYPDSDGNVSVRVIPERLARPEEDQFRTNSRAATTMLALVCLVMVVAGVNVVNLLLAQASGRRHELAIRAALGAGRGRLVRQIVTESLVLASMGGAAGTLLGTWAARVLATTRLPGDLPVRFDFRPDLRVVSYSAALAAVAGVLAGLIPATRVSADPDRALRQSGQDSPRIRGQRTRDLLVIFQIASCFVLLVAGGLLVRSLEAARHSDLGFRPDGVLNVQMDVGQLGYTEAQGRAFFEVIDRDVRAIPGVEHASFAFTVPMGYIRVSEPIEAEGRPDEVAGRVSAGKNIIGPDYFETMGIRVVEGRAFDRNDNERSPRVAIVNRRLAEILWPGRSPIGRRFRTADTTAWTTVVGTTPDGKYRFLFEDREPYFYVPIAQEYTGLRVLHVRTAMAPEALAPAIERVIRASEPNLPLYDVQSMRHALGSGLGFFPLRVGAAAAGTLGLLAFGLAIVGLYGVVSYFAGQRTHEIGVRMALGASKGDIAGLVLRDGAALVACGVAAGLLAVLAFGRVTEAFLFRVSSRDPATLVVVGLVLGCVSLAACAIPAARAARVDPITTLRSE